MATVVYDATFLFCDRFVNPRSRTHDQMVQAARSGRQNIAEGSRASAVSSKSELTLVNVARSSLDELLLDYEDFLRQRRIRQWRKDDAEALAVRTVGNQRDPEDLEDPEEHWKVYKDWLEHEDPGVVANALICLIHQANFLLDRQLKTLEQDFIEHGGYTERLAAARIRERERQRQDRSEHDSPLPVCPLCGSPMVVRTARKGKNPGRKFWGCSKFPACKGTRVFEG